MSQPSTPERRRSTGGLPPVRVRSTYVVEEAPSHDGTPCFTAWLRDEIITVPSGWNESDFPIQTRPRWSHQIYDTRPRLSIDDNAQREQRLKTLAERIHAETLEERSNRGRPDRVDVWGLPLPPGMLDEERAEICQAHCMAEIEARNKAGRDDFYIPQRRGHRKWEQAIIVVDRPEELWGKPGSWDEDEDEGQDQQDNQDQDQQENEDGNTGDAEGKGKRGGFLAVRWTVRDSYLSEIRDVALTPEERAHVHRDQWPAIVVERLTLRELGGELLDMCSSIEGFHQSGGDEGEIPEDWRLQAKPTSVVLQ